MKPRNWGTTYHADQRETHEDLVAHHLGCGAHAAQKRELVVRRPAREHDRIDAEATHGEEEQQPDIEIADDADRGRRRDDGHGEHHRDHRDCRR
jgi:hypothetical protein